MSADIFLAYSRSDETEAKALQHALKNWGYSIWYDADILPGVDWASEIKQQFRKSVCVLALLSESSLKSGYLEVYIKWGLARENLLPVAIQDRLDLESYSPIPKGTPIVDICQWRLTRDPRKLDNLLAKISQIVGRSPIWTDSTGRTEFRATRLEVPGERRSGYDIFLSYKSEDVLHVASFVEIFKSFGFSVWWDQMISSGQNWGFAIDRALTSSRCVVVFWTPQSTQSQEVYSEAEYGMRKNAYFPIKLQECEIPPRMTRAQWVDLTHKAPLDSEKFHLLVDQLRKRVENPP
jgi:hypothetical protein